MDKLIQINSEKQNNIRIFIAEDEELFLNGINIVLDSEEDMDVVGTAANGVEALEKISHLQPDVTLIDIQMPKMNGIRCIKEIKKRYPEALILILTTFNEEEYIIEGLAHGASGYILKSVDFQNLINTIRNVYNGQYVLPAEVGLKLSKYLINSKKDNKKPTIPDFILSNSSFTTREIEIIKLLLERFSNQEIAERLLVSEGTIKNYLTIIYQKLQVTSRREAIKLLLQEPN